MNKIVSLNDLILEACSAGFDVMITVSKASGMEKYLEEFKKETGEP